MFTLFCLAALLVGFLRCLPVASVPTSLQKTCYLKPSPQGNNNYSTYFTYLVPESNNAGTVFLFPEQEVIPSEVMNSSISQLQEELSSALLDQDVPNGRFNNTTSQNVDYYLEEGFRGDLKYRHVAWSLDALQSLYKQDIFKNVVITVSDATSGGLCAVGGFHLSGDGTATTDSDASPSPTYTPKFVAFNYADPSNAYNTPIPSPAASDYPPGFGIPPLPSNVGESDSVLNLSADDTTAQVV